jgi:hypothetical protein
VSAWWQPDTSGEEWKDDEMKVRESIAFVKTAFEALFDCCPARNRSSRGNRHIKNIESGSTKSLHYEAWRENHDLFKVLGSRAKATGARRKSCDPSEGQRRGDGVECNPARPSFANSRKHARDELNVRGAVALTIHFLAPPLGHSHRGIRHGVFTLVGRPR